MLVAFLPRELIQVGVKEGPSCAELPAKLAFGPHPKILNVLSLALIQRFSMFCVSGHHP